MECVWNSWLLAEEEEVSEGVRASNMCIWTKKDKYV